MKRILFFILSLILVCGVAGQEIKISEFTTLPNDISAREHPIEDTHGTGCSLIKIRSGIEEIVFSSDYEIVKIEKHAGEYWLWISPESSYIEIETKYSDPIKYELPSVLVEYNVYLIYLEAISPPQVKYQRVNSINFITKPSKAQLFINGAFMGNTPALLKLPLDTFQYTLKKKLFSDIEEKFVFDELNTVLFHRMQKDPFARRIFFTINLSNNKFGTPFPTIQFGMLGNTGMYVAGFLPVYNFKWDLNVYPESVMGPDLWGDWYAPDGSQRYQSDERKIFLETRKSDPDHYFELQECRNMYYMNYRFSAGVTRQLGKTAFLFTGPGVGGVNQYFRLLKIPYSNDTYQEVALPGTFYGLNAIKDVAFTFDMGLILRIRNHLIIQSSTTLVFIYANTEKIVPDYSFGLGYNF